MVRLGVLPFFLPFFFNSELDNSVLSDIAESSKEESESLVFWFFLYFFEGGSLVSKESESKEESTGLGLYIYIILTITPFLFSSSYYIARVSINSYLDILLYSLSIAF